LFPKKIFPPCRLGRTVVQYNQAAAHE
jgi:hypothetical protein